MSWPLVKLADVSIFLRNGASIKQNTDAGGLPITRIETIAHRVVNLDKCGYADVGENDFENYRLQIGDILISHINSEKHLGKCAVYEEPRGDVVHGMNLLCLRPNVELVDYRYLFYCLSSIEFLRKLPKITKKSVNQASFTVTAFKELQIPLPPLKEQKRIAAILDKADSLRRKRQQAIDLADDFLRAVFLDMFGDPMTNPKGWRIENASDCFSVSPRNGLSPSNSGTVEGKVLTLSAITRGSFDINQSRLCMFDRPPSDNQMVMESDLLICRGNGNKTLVGRGLFPCQDYSSYVFPDTIIAAGIDTTKVTKEYFEFIWGAARCRNHIEKNARTTNGTYKINQGVINSVPVLVPPINLQEKYSLVSRRVKRLIDEKFSPKVGYSCLFSSLSQKAFAGQL